MKVLVTGGAGFIGSHLTKSLLKKGSVYVIDDLSTGALYNIKECLCLSNFRFIKSSILNKESLEPLIKNCDQIYHLAAAVGVDYVIQNPQKIMENNLAGTETLFELACKYNKLVFFASSSEVYYNHVNERLKENMAECIDNERSLYGRSKKQCEEIAEHLYKTKGFRIIQARYFNVIGPCQSEKFGMVVPRFVKQAMLGEPITVYGDGRQSRNFIDVRDVIVATVLLMNSKIGIGKIVNLGGDQEVSITKLARMIKQIAKSKSKIVYIPYEKTIRKNYRNPIKRKPDITELQKLISWAPTYRLQTTITDTINHARQLYSKNII